MSIQYMIGLSGKPRLHKSLTDNEGPGLAALMRRLSRAFAGCTFNRIGFLATLANYSNASNSRPMHKGEGFGKGTQGDAFVRSGSFYHT